jgi:MFS family permease
MPVTARAAGAGAQRLRSTVFPLAGTLAIQVLVSMSVVTVPVLAPAAAAESGMPLRYVGLFIALVYGTSMAASLASGPMVQRFGAIRVSQFCLLSCALGMALVASGHLAAVILAAVLLGLGQGPATPASSHVLARTTPPHMMAMVFSLKQTGVPLGGAFAGAIVPVLVLLGGWRVAALAVAVTCLLVLALAQGLRAELDADREPGRALTFAGLAQPLRFTLGDPLMRRLALCSFCFASLQLCLVTFLVSHLTLNLGMSLVRAGLMLTAAQAGGVVARILWGVVADRWGRPMALLGLLAFAMVAAAAATAQFTAQWPWPVIAAVCAAFGATAIGWNGVYLAQVARLAPTGKAGVATGGALVFTYAGVLFGPPAFSLMVGGGMDYSSAYVALAVPVALCGLWLLVREWRPGAARALAAGASGTSR